MGKLHQKQANKAIENKGLKTETLYKWTKNCLEFEQKKTKSWILTGKWEETDWKLTKTDRKLAGNWVETG